MSFADVGLIVCLLLFLGGAFLPRSRFKTTLLWVAPAVAAALSLWQISLGRWQAWAVFAVAILTLLVLAGSYPFQGKMRGKSRTWIIGFGLFLYTALGAAAGFLLWCFPTVSLPQPKGLHAVGTANFDLIDHRRQDPFDPLGGPRRVHVQVWYPATVTAQSKPKPYFTKAETDAMAAPFAVQFGQNPRTWTHLQLVRTNSYQDAAIRTDLGQLPVVIFNHGYWSIQMQNTVLMEDLASQGYLVLSLAHPHDSAAVLFNDGTVVQVDSSETMKIIMESEGLSDLETYLTATDAGARYEALMRLKASDLDGLRMFASSPVWRGDIAFVLDSIAADQVPEAVKQTLLQGDYDRLGLVGMSFGGSTTAGFCLRDIRCKAGVNLDGMAWDRDQYNATIPAPFMVLLGDPRVGRPNADIRFARTDFMYESVADAGRLPDKHRFLIAGSTHPDFTDFTNLLRGPARKTVMRLGTIPGDRMLTVTNRFVSDFFDTYLRGSDVAFPQAALSASPEASTHEVSYIRKWVEESGIEHETP